MRIREYLKTNKIICDGAFGTYYASLCPESAVPEKANLENPSVVSRIHAEYVEAGAGLLRTNTFAANSATLGGSRDYRRENIAAAVRLARQAAAGKACVAGDIGPAPLSGADGEERQLAEYLFMAETMLDAGADLILFETFPDYEIIRQAARILKERHGQEELFIAMQFQVNQHGYTNAGLSAKRIIEALSAEPSADAVGFNCGVGPAHMLRILEGLSLPPDKYLMTLPNAGYPKILQDRVVFLENKEYFAGSLAKLVELGADIVGGCCGTSPAYIARAAELADTAQRGQSARRKVEHPACAQGKARLRNSAFYAGKAENLRKAGKLLAVEIAPPFHADDEKVMDAANYLKRCRVDAITFPDSPSGRTRADSVMTGIKVAQNTGMCVMPHICCRDKNAIAIRAQLLGAYMNGIRNLLVVTGDPVPQLMRGEVRSVYNFDSVGLMKIIREMNEDEFAEDPIVYGGALSYGRPNLDVEIGRMHKKIEAGASFFLTQPLFTQEDAARLKAVHKQVPQARILCGVMPLVSRKNALFIQNEMTGIHVTDEIVSRFDGAGTREQGEAAGIRIAREVMGWTGDFAAGYYFSIPFNRVYLLEKILEP